MIEEDHCVYLKRSKKCFVILSLYVDDVLIAGNNMIFCDWLFLNFYMKDMCEANYILGVRIIRNHSKRFLGLPQEFYIQSILEHF